MGALGDLWKSERGIIAVFLIVAVTVLASLGKVTFDQWREYTLYIFACYTVSKTVTSVVETHVGGKTAIAGVESTSDADHAPAPAQETT